MCRVKEKSDNGDSTSGEEAERAPGAPSCSGRSTLGGYPVLKAIMAPKTRVLSLGILLVAISCTAQGRSLGQDGERSERRPWPKEIETSGARITIYEPQ